MAETLRKIADSVSFQRFITAVILLAGVLVGLQTYPDIVARYGGLIHALDMLILGVFVAEVVVRMGAHGSKPWRYFKDPWNVFDFGIVVACLLPLHSQFVVVLRLVRILRTVKLVRALPKLQIIIGALINSIPSMGYVSLLLFMLFYLYGVTATFIFGPNDPVHFGTLPISILSLFRVATLEGWTELMYIQMYGCAAYGYDGREALCTASMAMPVFSSLYFVSFVLFATMIVLNLFVAVMMNGMTEATQQSDDERRDLRDLTEMALHEEMTQLGEQLAGIQDQLRRLQRLAERSATGK